MPWWPLWGAQRARTRSAGVAELRGESVRAESIRGESARGDAVRDSGRGDAVRADSVRSESVRAESVRAESVRAESVRGEDAGLPSALASTSSLETACRLELPAQRGPESVVRPVNMRRVADSLDRLEIRYLTDGDGSLLAMWERHALLFALEGPDDEIIVMRGRPHATVPPDWADRSYRVVNEWNHTRRFCKAYVGDPTERGQLPIYAEIQVPLLAGVHDALLDEMLDCAAAVTSAFVDWLYDEGALL